MSEAEHVVRTFFQSVQERDLGRIDALVATQARGQGSHDELFGAEGARALVERVHGAFDDVQLEIQSIHGEGPLTVHWTIEGTHSGEWQGRKGQGERVSARGISVIEVDCGQIANASWLSNLASARS